MSLQAASAAALAQLLAPLATAAGDPDRCAELLAALGVPVEVPAEALAQIRRLLAAEQVEELLDLASRHAAGTLDTGDLVARGLPLARSVGDAVAGLAGLRAADLAGLVAPLDDPATWAAVAAALPDHLLLQWVRLWHPLAFALLELGGVVTRSEPDVRSTLSWDALGQLIADPASRIGRTYGWGGRLDHAGLVTRLHAVLHALGVDARAVPLDPAVEAAHFGGAAPPDVAQLSLPLFAGGTADGAAYVLLGLLAAPVPRSGAGEPDSVLITSEVAGSVAEVLDLGGGWRLTLSGGAGSAGGLGVVVSPGRTVPAGPAAVAGASIRLATTEVPMHLLGDGSGTGLDLESVSVEVRTGDGDVTVEVGTDDGLVLVVDPGEADSFLAAALGAAPLSVRTGLTVSWSSSAGVRLGGAAGFSVVIPVDRTVGPLTVDSVRLALTGGTGGVALEVAGTGSLVLGPFVAVVEDIGLRAALVPAPAGGADLELGFKPPTGVGLGLDVEGILTGGGFLSLDPATGRYAGVASLSMLGIGVTAVGIVETRLPGDGWSLFLSVVAEFTPVPLGFGFTLNGVGGFLGLHRVLDGDALGLGVREGRVDSVLFPSDPLANATRILADVAEFFPSRVDSHTFGLMVKIGWGVPTILTLEAGVVLSVPEVVVAVVGELACVLPDPAAPLLSLHMGVVGVLDVAAATLSVTASIHDSQLAGISLSGDMALHVSLGADPYFLFSVGGYAPGWKPPASVPSSLRDLGRMAAAIDLGSTLDVGLDSYVAVTPNTVQFGAEVYAVARVRELGVDFRASGSFGFDVQVTFSPFRLAAGMHAGVTIEAEGFTLLAVQLRLHLEGPDPWYGSGTAAFTFLGMEVPFHVAVGGPVADAAPPTVDLWGSVLAPALADPAAWEASAASGDVVLRPVDPAAEPGLWLGPEGRVSVRQRLVPLNRDVSAYGTLVPSGGVARFDVMAAGLVSDVDSSWTVVEEFFAPAQFTAMTPAERLSAPSYEEMDAGISLVSTGWTIPVDEEVAVVLGYEQTVRDGPPTVTVLDASVAAGLLTPSARWTSALPATPLRHPVTSEVATGALRPAPTRYALVDPLTARPVAAPGLAYADLAPARRVPAAGAARPRIVPLSDIRLTVDRPEPPVPPEPPAPPGPPGPRGVAG